MGNHNVLNRKHRRESDQWNDRRDLRRKDSLRRRFRSGPLEGGPDWIGECFQADAIDGGERQWPENGSSYDAGLRMALPLHGLDNGSRAGEEPRAWQFDAVASGGNAGRTVQRSSGSVLQSDQPRLDSRRVQGAVRPDLTSRRLPPLVQYEVRLTLESIGYSPELKERFCMLMERNLSAAYPNRTLTTRDYLVFLADMREHGMSWQFLTELLPEQCGNCLKDPRLVGWELLPFDFTN